MKSINRRPAWLPWSSLAPSQILPRSTLIKALPPHSQPGAIFVMIFSSNTAGPLGTYLGELKDPPAGCGANTWITFLLDLFFEIPNLARFLSDDSKSPVPLSNLLTSPRVTQKPEKDAPTTFYREWYKAPLCGQKYGAHGLQCVFILKRPSLPQGSILQEIKLIAQLDDLPIVHWPSVLTTLKLYRSLYPINRVTAAMHSGD